jgi:hypothetical protein
MRLTALHWAAVLAVMPLLALGCRGKSADDFPPHLTFATVTYPVGVVSTPAGCPTGWTCLAAPKHGRCPIRTAKCFTVALRRYPNVHVEMVRYNILCHGVSGPTRNPPGTCQAIISLVSLQAKGNATTCECPGQVLPAGRVVGRVNGSYVDEAITGCLCGLETADANQAANDRSILMPRGRHPSAQRGD